MITLNKNDAKASLADYVDQINNDPIVVTVGDKPVAVLLPLDNIDLETLSLSLNPQFQAIIERSRLRDETEGRLSSEEVRRMFAAEK
ncbi:MAG: type II toxin-antitoxin system Phd/YefM family antitoxin [Anaerolineae bacterium]|nr:type II toxin-antitoxin system Phd/YefM family antitoxin [Anaerolineae bacterium]